MSNLAFNQSELGIFDLPMEVYRKSDALNFSGLSKLAQSPAHYQAYRLNPPEPTSAMTFGTAVHAAILEQGLDKKLVVKAPLIDKRTKLGKSEWEAFELENRGKLVLNEDAFQKVIQIRDAIFNHPVASQLLNPTEGDAERSAFWIDPETQVLCKLRADFLRHDGLVIDLKTSIDASPREFQRTIANFKYHWQSAFYLDGLSHLVDETLNQFIHIVVEKEPPFGIGIYVLDDVSLLQARHEISLLKAIYAKCKNENHWPNYSEQIQNISIPGWMIT